ncbi:MAG: hypothetical protein GY809_04190 [Planctomycetes bacterium]|nr:hypothetical protein [Planctomycetota bacterium]
MTTISNKGLKGSLSKHGGSDVPGNDQALHYAARLRIQHRPVRDMMLGDAAKEVTVTQEMFARWKDDGATVAAINAAAEKLKTI